MRHTKMFFAVALLLLGLAACAPAGHGYKSVAFPKHQVTVSDLMGERSLEQVERQKLETPPAGFSPEECSRYSEQTFEGGTYEDNHSPYVDSYWESHEYLEQACGSFGAVERRLKRLRRLRRPYRGHSWHHW